MKVIGYLVVALAILFSCQLYADADEEFREALAGKIAVALKKGDFAALELLENGYLDPSVRSPSGKIILSIFASYLESYLTLPHFDRTSGSFINPFADLGRDQTEGPDPSAFPEANRHWDAVGGFVAEWERQYPESPNPKIAKAIYFLNRAHYFRGSTWAAKVHPEAWPVHASNLESAKRVLTGSAKTSRNNPVWFDLRLRIAGIQSADRQEIDLLIKDTLENSRGYMPALQAAFHFMSPRWGGSYAEMDAFAQLANAATRTSMGGETYARIYWNLVATIPAEINLAFFQRTKASWPLLDESFGMMTKNHPTERNFSGHALFACMAGEFSRARELITKAGTVDHTAIWPQELRLHCYPRSVGNPV